MKLLCIIFALSTFGSFIWSVKSFFQREGQLPSSLKLQSLIGIFIMLTHLTLLIFLKTSDISSIFGIVFYAYSFALFWWTIDTNWQKPLTIAYTEDTPQHLQKKGPYQWIRHPFYTSYLIAWFGGPVATNQIWLFLTVLILFVMYYKAARFEEEKFLKSDFSEEYQEYRAKTGMFLPF